MTRWLVPVVLVVTACAEPPLESQPTPPKRPSAGFAFSPPAGFDKLRFGLIPLFAKDTMRAAHAKLGDYLGKQLSVPVEIIVGDTYDDTLQRFEKGELELIELSPLGYARLSKTKPLRCLVQSIADGSETTAGYIFVRDDSPRRTLEELKGARFGFVDRSSTSGYLYPMKLLKDRGLDPKRDFASAEFLGNHESVLMAVLDGRLDAGATYQGAFNALRRAKGIDPLSFRIIAKTPRTPREIYCVSSSVPSEVAEALTMSLLALSGRDRAGREILAPISLNGFRTADDHAYDDVRRVAAELDAQ